MSNSGKVGVTILLIVGFFIVGIFLQAAGTSQTFLGLLALGLFFGIRSMWKKPKDEKGSDEITLDKNRQSDDLTKS